jgi:DNA-binding CsgD family transcriptional regulator
MTAEQRARAKAEILRLAATDIDQTLLWAQATELIRSAMPFATSCWHQVDPATMLITSHFNELGEPMPPGWTENEYQEDDVGKFADLARSRQRAGSIHTLTDGQPRLSARYLGLLQPHGFEDELRVAFVDGSTCWGGALFLREEGKRPFEPRDAEFLSGISTTIAQSIRRSVLLAKLDRPHDAPGVIVLDGANRVESLSQQALVWLGEMGSSESADLLPSPIYAVAAAARAAIDAAHWVPARLRTVTTSGQWLVMHGSLMEGGEAGRVAVIVEPAGAPEIAPLIAAAYGLSPREREVAEQVMQGYSTAEIARRLYVSPYTVQDHLKAIFEKIGVRSRRELMGRVFSDHYRPALSATEPNV